MIAILFIVTGCKEKHSDNEYLVRVGASEVTVRDFKRNVAAASEEAFPGEAEIDMAALNDLRMRLLNQTIEELLICERAGQIGVILSDAELDEAVAAIKADYPDDTFTETLLENAVSFDAWKKKLGVRLLTEKVIAKELVDQVQITSEDVATYYKTHYPEGPEENQDLESLNKRIVKHLRKQKAEQAYKAWIEKLRQEFKVDVNHNQWQRITGEK